MLEITKYQVIFKIVKPVIFTTYPGFYLRNALVKALVRFCKNQNRIKNQKITNCHGCKHQPGCPYFALNLPVEEPVAEPLPMSFILNVDHLIIGKYESGYLTFDIILFGNAARYAEQLGESFRDVGNIFGLGENGISGNISFISMRQKIKTGLSPIVIENYQKTDAATLVFKHLKLSDQAMRMPFELPIEGLIKSISSRFLKLELLYGNGITNSNSIHSAEFNPSTQQCENLLSKCNYQYAGSKQGHYFLSGSVIFSGEIMRSLPMLHVGSRIGIGRFTS